MTGDDWRRVEKIGVEIGEGRREKRMKRKEGKRWIEEKKVDRTEQNRTEQDRTLEMRRW